MQKLIDPYGNVAATTRNLSPKALEELCRDFNRRVSDGSPKYHIEDADSDLVEFGSLNPSNERVATSASSQARHDAHMSRPQVANRKRGA